MSHRFRAAVIVGVAALLSALFFWATTRGRFPQSPALLWLLTLLIVAVTVVLCKLYRRSGRLRLWQLMRLSAFGALVAFLLLYLLLETFFEPLAYAFFVVWVASYIVQEWTLRKDGNHAASHPPIVPK